jgi:arylsulfatase
MSGKPSNVCIPHDSHGNKCKLRSGWKVVFLEQNHTGMGVWQHAFTELRAPKIFNLLSDPFERGNTSIE